MKNLFDKEPFEIDTEFDEEVGLFEEFEDEELFDTEGPDFEWEGEVSQARRIASQKKVNQQRVAMGKLGQAIQRMQRFVRKKDGRLRFTLPVRTVEQAATRLGLEPAIVGSLLRSLRQTNERLARGMQSRSELEMESSLYPAILGEVSGTSCPGVTRLTTHWWGIRLWLNECHTGMLRGALTTGGGAAGLCAVITPIPHAKILCGVAGGLFAVGIGAITIIDALGGNRGIIITRPWVIPPIGVPVPPVIIWHQ